MQVNVNLLNRTNQRVAVLKEKPVRFSKNGYAGIVHKGKIFPLYEGNVVFAHDTTYDKKDFLNFAKTASDFVYHKTDEWISDYESEDRKKAKSKIIKSKSKTNSKTKKIIPKRNRLEAVKIFHCNLWPEPAFISRNEEPSYPSGSHEPNVAPHDEGDPRFFNSNSKRPNPYNFDEYDDDEEESLPEPSEHNCEDYTALKFDRGDKEIEIGVFALLRHGWRYANQSQHEDERIIINGHNTCFAILHLIQTFREPELITVFIDMRETYQTLVQYDNSFEGVYCEEVYEDLEQKILVKTRSHGILRINSKYEFEEIAI